MQTLLPINSPASYVANDLNQYTSVDNTNPLYYDDNGNLTAFDGWSYGYDAHNRLVSASRPAGTSLDLDYDPNGRLSSTTLDGSTTDYVYSGAQLIGEFDPLGNPVNLYVYAPGSDIPMARFSGSNGLNDMQYLRADERGSIVIETDGTLVLESHQYDVYGVPLEESDSLFRYTGQIQLKGTGLYHYKARAYHPGLGRFLQTDPIGYDDGMNMYAYVGNDPVNAVDPSGMVNTERFASTSGKFINSKQLSGYEIGEGAPQEENAQEEQVGVDYYHIDDPGIEPSYLIEGVVFWPWRATAGLLRGTGALIGLSRGAATLADDALRVGGYSYTKTAAGHLASRPYMNSPSVVNEIMATGKSIPDPGGVAGALRFDVAGSFNGSPGAWQLVVHPEGKKIYHFLFKSTK